MEINKEQTGLMKAVTIISSIVLICAGCYLFFRPRSIVVIFSAGVLVHGILLIVKYFSAKENRNGWDIIGGVINVLFGAIMLFGGTHERVLGLVAIEMYIAIWAIFAGVANTMGSFGLKKMGAKGWVWALIGGILTIICGFVLISAPLMGTLVLVGFGGIYAAVSFLIMGFTGLAAGLSGKAVNFVPAAATEIVSDDAKKDGGDNAQ